LLVKTIIQQEMLQQDELQGKAVVVIDVLRASSSMVTALANGAKAVMPAPDVQSACQLREKSNNSLLAGERNGCKIPGFELGNSPLEYTKDRLKGKTLIMITTNGTRALLAAQQAEQILAASFLNSTAAAKMLLALELDVVLLCAGTKGRFSLEDFAAAGMLATALLELGARVRLKDETLAAAALYEKYSGQLETMLCKAEHGHDLAINGFSRDLSFCAQKDIFDAVPRKQEDGSFASGKYN